VRIFSTIGFTQSEIKRILPIPIAYHKANISLIIDHAITIHEDTFLFAQASHPKQAS
jgi:hypothetical protein